MLECFVEKNFENWSCDCRYVFQDIFETSTEIKLLQSRNLTIFGNLNLDLLKIKPVKNKIFALQKNLLLFSKMLMWRIWIKAKVKIGSHNCCNAFIVKWIRNVLCNIEILYPKWKPQKYEHRKGVMFGWLSNRIEELMPVMVAKLEGSLMQPNRELGTSVQNQVVCWLYLSWKELHLNWDN